MGARLSRTCMLQGNLQVEILIKSLEMGQQRYDLLVFATGPDSWNSTCAVSLPVSFKTVAKLRRLISLPTTIQFAVIAMLRRLVLESTMIQFNIFRWDSVADNRACHVLLTGLVADAGKLRRLSCSQDDFIYFLVVAATSLRAGFLISFHPSANIEFGWVLR